MGVCDSLDQAAAMPVRASLGMMFPVPADPFAALGGRVGGQENDELWEPLPIRAVRGPRGVSVGAA